MMYLVVAYNENDEPVLCYRRDGKIALYSTPQAAVARSVELQASISGADVQVVPCVPA